MSKTLPYPALIDSPFTILVHFGDPFDPPDQPWHLVYAYPAEYQYLLAIGANGLYFPTVDQAHNTALGLASLPQVSRDWCNACRWYGYTGVGELLIPRWNIHNDERGEPLVPCIYWDYFADSPPPGFSWTP